MNLDKIFFFLYVKGDGIDEINSWRLILSSPFLTFVFRLQLKQLIFYRKHKKSWELSIIGVVGE